jgi:hypothetical protein
MLLPTYLPEMKEEFKHIYRFTEKILRYIKNAKEDNLDIDKFSMYFGVESEKTHWLLETDSIKKAIDDLLKMNTTQRKLLHRIFKKDNSLAARWEPGMVLSFDLTKSENKKLRETAKEFFEPLYSKVLCKTGFREIAGLDDGSYVKRQDFKNAFLAAQKPKEFDSICPACLGDIAEVTEQGTYADVDHFFPKKLYPTLVVSLYNLVPTCIACNTRAKREKDPLLEFEFSNHFSTFLPYQGDKSYGLQQIRFQFKGVRQVKVLSIDPEFQIAVKNFKRLYNLDARYTGKLQGVIRKLLLTELRSHLEYPFTREQIVCKLQVIADKKMDAYKNPDSYLLGYFAKYLSQMPFFLDGIIDDLNKRSTTSKTDGEMQALRNRLFEDLGEDANQHETV